MATAKTPLQIMAGRMAASYFKSFEDSTELAQEIENHLIVEGVLENLEEGSDTRAELIELTTDLVSKMLQESGSMLEYDADNAQKARANNLDRLKAVNEQFSLSLTGDEIVPLANALFGGSH